MEMKIKEVCKKCGCVNELESININTVFLKDESGKEYKVLYYLCDSCRKRNAVQIDDDETLRIHKSLNELVVKAAAKNVSHEDIPKQWIGKRNALNGRLTSLRNGLKKRLDGKVLINEGKNIEITI